MKRFHRDLKVKCDREDPCLNCVDARAECLRTRQARIHRPRVSRCVQSDIM